MNSRRCWTQQKEVQLAYPRAKSFPLHAATAMLTLGVLSTGHMDHVLARGLYVATDEWKEDPPRAKRPPPSIAHPTKDEPDPMLEGRLLPR
eukprot:scaffold225416_cov41-Prasinocladus_malaysianus.AAC.2